MISAYEISSLYHPMVKLLSNAALVDMKLRQPMPCYFDDMAIVSQNILKFGITAQPTFTFSKLTIEALE